MKVNIKNLKKIIREEVIRMAESRGVVRHGDKLFHYTKGTDHENLEDLEFWQPWSRSDKIYGQFQDGDTSEFQFGPDEEDEWIDPELARRDRRGADKRGDWEKDRYVGDSYRRNK